MQLMNEIPDTFWSLFRSVNRDIYIEALLCINEEYEYNNYFLTKEVCIQILSDMNAKKRFELQREENDTDFDMLETPSSRILNWLLRAGWLKRIEDYNTLVTNIVIPDYAAVMIDAFEKLNSEDASETDIYIQNVYATLYAFRNDPRASVGLLRTALVNTRRLNNPSFTARLKSLSTITPSPISVYLYASSPTYHPPSVFFRQMTVGITQVSSRPATAAWV